VAEDIRLLLGFPDNPKTKRLVRIYGIAAIGYLVFLWDYCGRYRQKGDLSALTTKEIAEICHYEGDHEAFIQTLIAEKWLEKTAGNRLLVHDWKDSQPWIYFSKERSQKAKKSAEIKWKTHYANRRQIAERIADNSQGNRRANAYAPSPIPSPSPTPSPAPSPANANGSHGQKALTLFQDLSKTIPSCLAQNEILSRVQTQSDLQKFENVVRAWILSGFSPNNFKGIFQWFENGVPEYKRKAQSEEEKQVEEERIFRERLEYKKQVELAGKSLFGGDDEKNI
jgi:hypothetical protein